ncbi:DUF1697 domain-containing protein [Ideonella sp. A 288]|uniref:DUF1697 domain-containing protein n=1 Tax=Ideonella sp. A 288 TaxID=1962181 RepID=UPI001303633E|nr:DUF1697 domain-containing protein [Ideonella sp. A 288]
MPHFVVLLRGVNVGKGHRVPMAGFSELLEALGFTDVSTLLNSGNAVGRSSGRSTTAHADAIGQALQARFGFTVTVVVKSAVEFLAAVAENPFVLTEAEHPSCLVAFAQEPAAVRALQALAPLVRAPERFAVGAQAAYLRCPEGILDSAVASALLGKAGRAVTTRNWATVLKLQALVRPLAVGKRPAPGP